MKKILGLVLVMMMVLSMAACTTATPAPTGTSDPTPAADKAADGTHPEIKANLTVAQHRTDLETEFSNLITSFNKIYPNVKVEIESVADYPQTMAVRIAGGEVSDVLEIRDSVIPANKWPDYFASLEDCDLPEMLFSDYYTVDGVLYGACGCTGYRSFCYNKALYDKAGIESVPTTWAEFMEAMKSWMQSASFR